jgi:hypothetical protein
MSLDVLTILLDSLKNASTIETTDSYTRYVTVRLTFIMLGDHRGRDRMIARWTTTYAISAYHH